MERGEKQTQSYHRSGKASKGPPSRRKDARDASRAPPPAGPPAPAPAPIPALGAGAGPRDGVHSGPRGRAPKLGDRGMWSSAAGADAETPTAALPAFNTGVVAAGVTEESEALEKEVEREGGARISPIPFIPVPAPPPMPMPLAAPDPNPGIAIGTMRKPPRLEPMPGSDDEAAAWLARGAICEDEEVDEDASKASGGRVAGAGAENCAKAGGRKGEIGTVKAPGPDDSLRADA